MRRKGLSWIFTLFLASAAASLPPDEPVPVSPEVLRDRLLNGSPDVRAEAAAALVLDPRPECASLVEALLADGELGAARELLLFLADRPAPVYATALVRAAARNGLAEPANAALEALGRSEPLKTLAALRESLARAPLEERGRWVAALGHARTSKAVPVLMGFLKTRDAEAAMAALRRITTLNFTQPRDWNFWWESHRGDSLEDILRDANRRMKDENAALRAQLEREVARANDLEKAGLKERLLAARQKKDEKAERAILEKEFTNVQPGLRAWAAEEVRLALAPADLLPGVLRLAQSDPVVAVRVAAIRTAGSVGKGAVTDLLKSCLNDPEEAVRVAAVAARAEAGGADAVDDIRPMLGDGQPRAVREASIVALKGLKPRGFAPVAAAMLEAEMKKPAAESVAGGLVELLGALRDPETVKTLVAVLQDSQDKNLRFRAVRSLGEIGHASAVAPLIAELDRPAAQQEKDVVAEAVSALARVGGEEARMRLESALQDFLANDNKKARENAARGLAKLGTTASVTPLMKCAKTDPDLAVRKEAWASSFALADAATSRFDALEDLIARLDRPEDAGWRVQVRVVIVKPGNFPADPERVKRHVRPLAEDYFRDRDWLNAKTWFEEAMKSAPEDKEIQVRLVVCRTRAADHAGAVGLGGTLLPNIPATTPAGVDLRRALIESRSALREYWRARALVPDVQTAASLPREDRDWFEEKRLSLDAAIREQIAEVEKRFPGYPSLPEAEQRAFHEFLRVAPPKAAGEFLLGKLASEDKEAQAAAAKLLEVLTQVRVPPDAGEARQKALEEIRNWIEKQTP
ncbi:MAG: HEAT repeat domain-containing protein [Planctomycetes bacterium]|nr:HEAT repeat domain-containing protein [Planctomycetota bacterium]